MRLVPAILANLLLAVAAIGAGSFLERALPKSFRTVDRVAAVLVGGLGITGTVLFLVGLVRLSIATVLGVLLPLALLGILFFAKKAQHISTDAIRKIPLLPASIVILMIVVTFVGGLAEPVGDFHDSDSIAYHYLGPRVWLRQGVIHPVPDESLTSFPAVVETLFASVMALGGPRAMALFAVWSFISVMLIVFGLALKLNLDSRGAWWAIALVATMPAVYRGCYGGFIDAIVWSFVLLSLRCALEGATAFDYLLSGVFSGLAMGAKYLGVIAFAIILFCSFVHYVLNEKQSLSLALKRLALVTAGAVTVGSPWYLRNWIVLGFPLYPPTRTLSRFFPVKYMSQQAIAYLGAVVDRSGAGMGHDPLGFVLLPFRLTFHPANYLSGAGGVGLTLLSLAPFGILVCWKKLTFARISVVFMFLSTLAWYFTEQDTRFLMHVFLFLAVFAVWGWRFVIQRAPRFGTFLAGITVGCSILYGLVMILPGRAEDARAGLSSAYEQQRKQREIPFDDSFNWLNRNPAVTKVLVPEPLVPTYYLEKDYLKPVGRFGERPLPGVQNVDDALAHLSQLGITHVLDVNPDRMLKEMEMQRPEQGFWLRQPPENLKLVLERDDQRIYEVILPHP